MKDRVRAVDRLPRGVPTRPLIGGRTKAATSQRLMRSRYSAYVRERGPVSASVPQRTTEADYDGRGPVGFRQESAEWRLAAGSWTPRAATQGRREARFDFVVTFTEKKHTKKRHKLSTFSPPKDGK